MLSMLTEMSSAYIRHVSMLTEMSSAILVKHVIVSMLTEMSSAYIHVRHVKYAYWDE